MEDFLEIFYKVLAYTWFLAGTALLLWLLNHMIGY